MPTINKPPRKPKKITSAEKKKEMHRYYASREWGALRKLKLQEHPMCEICGRKLAEEVHHIDSPWKYDDPLVRKAKTIYVDLKDLMSLCSECHMNLHKEQHKKKIKR